MNRRTTYLYTNLYGHQSVDESQVLWGEGGPEEGEARPEAARGGPLEQAVGGEEAPLVPVQEVLQRPVAAVPVPGKYT